MNSNKAITERRVKLQGEIHARQREIDELQRAEDNLRAAQDPDFWPQDVKALATRLHEIGCQFDHTEHCAWHYDKNRPFALGRGRLKYGALVKAGLALGYEISSINELLDQLPAGDVQPTKPRVRSPKKAEVALAEAMHRAFTVHFEGSMHWGRGWRRDGTWRSTRLWGEENDSQQPWSGVEHRRMLAAARSWARATGLEMQQLTQITQAISPSIHGC